MTDEEIQRAIEWYETQNNYYSDKEVYQKDFKMNIIAITALQEMIKPRSEDVQRAIDFVEEFADAHCAEWRNKISKKIGDDCSEEEGFVKLILTALRQMQVKGEKE